MMKYTIEGFSQRQLIAWNLDATDAVILRYVVDFWNTGKMKNEIFDGKEFFWVNHQSVLNEVPIIGISSKIVLARRFKKYKDCGLMEHHTKRSGGTFSFYRFTDSYDKLISDAGPNALESKTPPGTNALKSKRVNALKSKSKDSSSRENYSTKKDTDTAVRVLDYLNDKTGKKYRKTVKANLAGIHARLKDGATEEDCRYVIDVKWDEWSENADLRKNMNPVTLFRPANFDRYRQQEQRKTRVLTNGKAAELAELLFRFAKQIPFNSVMSMTQNEEIDRWALPMQDIMEIDGYSAADVEQAIRYANYPGNFWNGRVSFPDYLRKKMPTLYKQMKAEELKEG